MLIAGSIHFPNKQGLINNIPHFFRKVPMVNSEKKFLIDFEFMNHKFIIKQGTTFENAEFLEISEEPKEIPMVINDGDVAKALGVHLSQMLGCFVFIWYQEECFNLKIEGTKKTYTTAKSIPHYHYYLNGRECSNNASNLSGIQTKIYSDPDVINK